MINIGSIVGKMGNLGQANYTASKSGVVGFTKTAAKELAQFDVRVNCILLGFIRTPWPRPCRRRCWPRCWASFRWAA